MTAEPLSGHVHTAMVYRSKNPISIKMDLIKERCGKTYEVRRIDYYRWKVIVTDKDGVVLERMILDHEKNLNAFPDFFEGELRKAYGPSAVWVDGKGSTRSN